MIKDLLHEMEDKTHKSIEATKREMASIRTGRANPALLDRIHVDYYGSETPLSQVANISVPEPRLLSIQPWDKSMISVIERAIGKSDLNLPTSNDGQVIRIVIPQLTEERRRELVKTVGRKIEEGRVAIRNVRRDVNDHLKQMQKNGDISEDELHRAQEQAQKITDKAIDDLNAIEKHKEKEIMEV
ncbi:MAG: ribosome recycling factor [bacterium]|nr:ribosome recycling factor [bacterium]